MRKAQYKIPGADGDPGDAQCVVYYFGPGQGGSAKNNADRWIAQFTQPDGTPSKDRARILFQSFGTAQAMLVEVKGTYNPQSMDGSPGTAALPGSMLIGAIVPGPDAPWFFKMTGPERTVEKNRGAFQELLKSVGSAGQ